MADELNSVYGHKFLRHNRAFAKGSAVTVATSLYNMFQPKSVVDLGSGGGYFINGFAPYGIECVGVDGSESGKLLLKPEVTFVLQDFQKPFVSLKRFDLVICFEVAEHLHARYSHILLDGLMTFVGKTLAFTAAPDDPNDGHKQHIHLRPREYWLNELKGRGLTYLEDITELLRKAWKHAGVFTSYYNNLIVCSRDKPKIEQPEECMPF